MSEVGIVAVEHEDHSFGRRGGGVSIGGQFDCFPFVVEDCKVDEVGDGVGMLALRVGGGVLILLGVLNELHLLVACVISSTDTIQLMTTYM